MIKVGDKLPEATFVIQTADGPTPKTTSEVFGGKKSVLFAVPGAFTPTCHNNHMPSFLNNLDALAAKGIELVACTAVNDVFVMAKWGEATGALGKIEMLADGSAAFAKAIGMELDLTEKGLGMRSKRYAAVIEDGVVTALMVEDNPGQAQDSTAEAVLATL